MSKQALGRNLEALLEGKNQNAAKPETPAPAADSVSPGVRVLMRGSAPAPEAAPASPAIPSSRKPPIPRWYLFAGDVLLAALALIILWKSPHPLSWQRELFCAGAVALGACLAVIALKPPAAK